MMDQLISLEEMLWHYVSRMHLAIENIETQEKHLKEALVLLDDCAKGDSFELMYEKMVQYQKDSKEIKSHFEDALYFLRRQILELEDFMG